MASVNESSPAMSAPAPRAQLATLSGHGPASPLTPVSPADFALLGQDNITDASTTSVTTATAHEHRLNHSASKLPAFRFADLNSDTLILPARRQDMPPSPVSPAESTDTNTARHLDSHGNKSQTEPMSASGSAAIVPAVSVSDPRPAHIDPPISAAGRGDSGSCVIGSGCSAPDSFPLRSFAPSSPDSAPAFSTSVPSFSAPAPSFSTSAPSPRTPALQIRQEHPQDPQNSQNSQVPQVQDTHNTKDTQIQDSQPDNSRQSSSTLSSSPPSSPFLPSTAIAITASFSSQSPAPSSPRILTSIEFDLPIVTASPTSPSSPSFSASLSPSKQSKQSPNPTPKLNYASLFHDSPPRVVISAASSFSSPASAPPASPLQSPLSPRFPGSLQSPLSPCFPGSPHSPRSPRSPSPQPASPTSSSSSPRLLRTLTYPSPTRKRADRRAASPFSANVSGPALVSRRPLSSSPSPSSPPPPSFTPRRPLSGLSTKEWARGQRDLILTTKANSVRSTHATQPEATPSPSQYHQSRQSQDSQQSTQSDSQQSDSHPHPSQPLPDDRRKTTSRPPLSFRRPRNEGGSTSRNSSIGSTGSSPTTATSATSVSVSIPPIRSFRSSGSRKSLGLDNATIMSLRSPGVGAAFDDADTVDGGGALDPRQRDHTLRALEGRADRGDDHGHTQVHTQVYAPRRQSTNYYRHGHSQSQSQAMRSAETDNTADIFMRIARDDDPAMSRTARQSSQRRPFSVAVPSRQSSPPQVTRRLSDQRDTVRQRRYADDQAVRQPASTMSASHRDNPPRVIPGDRSMPPRSSTMPHRPEPIRTRTVVNSTRPSPTTPRTSVFYDTTSEVGTAYSRRRPSVDTGNTNQLLPLRASSIKTAHNFPRAYSSSPLAPRPADPQRQEGTDAGNNGISSNTPGGAPVSTPVTANATGNTTSTGAAVEGTESSASTAAPSTVWDELDDLKSRMRRLELSGKIPPTAGAAMSRVSDDRPRTATTSATNMSGSPKRSSNAGNNSNSNNQSNNNNTSGSQVGDHRSTTSSSYRQQQQQQDQPAQLLQSPMQRDVHQSNQNQPILVSALNKARHHVSADIYSAIEAAATEAMSLSQMVGVAGQPGPISSGASSIGTSMPSTVTDRQLRRKAESICRSLTELCLALNDDAAQRKAKAATAAIVAAAHANVSSAQTSTTNATIQQQQQEQQAQQQQASQAQPQRTQTPNSSSSQLATTSAPSSQHPLEHTSVHAHSRSQPQQSLQIQTHQLPRDDAGLISPTTTTRAFASLASSRRAATGMDQSLMPKVQQSPRAATRYEDRRASLLTNQTLPMPRYGLAPPMASENVVGRRSSLMMNQMRRATSEEPDDQSGQNAGRRSSMLRTRRAATEEPEESAAVRKTSLLIRTRRAAIVSAEDAGDEDQDNRAPVARSPARTVTEVATLRSAREYHRQPREYLPREYASTRDYAAREYQYPGQILQTSRTAPLLSSMANGNGSQTTVLTIPSNVSTVGYDNTPSSPTAVSPRAIAVSPRTSGTFSASVHTSPLASSALPRRRLVPSSLNSRLVTPQVTTTTATSMTAAAGSTSASLLASRRFMERSAPERERSGERERDAGASLVAADKYVEERLQDRLHERVQRQLAMGQSAPSLLGRTTTVNQTAGRRPNMSSATSQVGTYR